MSLESADTALEFQKAVSDFNEAAFFECHEILEDLWRPMPTSLPLKAFLQGWIQVAVGLHHWQQNNAVGAHNLLDTGLCKLKANLNLLPNDWFLAHLDWPRLITETSILFSIMQDLKNQGKRNQQLPSCTFPKLS